jgi:hypothetical protein
MHPREPKLKEGGRFSFGHLLLEVVMIVFSILLALSVESCHEQRKQRELANIALAGIRAELVSNKEQIALRLPYQKQQIEALNAIVAANQEGKPTPLKMTYGMAPPLLMSSAFEAATATNALARTDYETVLKISRVYTFQRSLIREEDAWIKVVTSLDSWDIKNAGTSAGLLAGFLKEYTTGEERLVARLDEVITRIDNGPVK